MISFKRLLIAGLVLGCATFSIDAKNLSPKQKEHLNNMQAANRARIETANAKKELHNAEQELQNAAYDVPAEQRAAQIPQLITQIEQNSNYITYANNTKSMLTLLTLTRDQVMKLLEHTIKNINTYPVRDIKKSLQRFLGQKLYTYAEINKFLHDNHDAIYEAALFALDPAKSKYTAILEAEIKAKQKEAESAAKLSEQERQEVEKQILFDAMKAALNTTGKLGLFCAAPIIIMHYVNVIFNEGPLGIPGLLLAGTWEASIIVVYKFIEWHTNHSASAKK